MNTIFLTFNIYVGLSTLFTDPCSGATGDLIKSFTVNGASNVSVAVGESVTFVCTKQDAVNNPKWEIQALASGEYLAGGTSITFQSASISIGKTAKCSYNGTVQCRATSGTTTDAKNVTVIVACTADGNPVTTTPKNGGTAIVMMPILLFSSVISIVFILHGKKLIF